MPNLRNNTCCTCSPVAVLLRSCVQSGGMDPPCHLEASSRPGWSAVGEVVMGHEQVKVIAWIQYDKPKQINILSFKTALHQ